MTIFRTALLVLLAVAIGIVPATADETLKLDNIDKTISYAYGRQLGENFKASGLDIDVEVFAAAVAEALAGKPDRLTDADRMAVSNELQKRQAEMQAKQAAANQEFLDANAKKEGVKVLPSGLQYKVLKSGDGKKPSATDSVTVHYRGTLVDGTEFDSSYKRGKPATFPVNGVIKGWVEALQLMQEGDTWQLVIPGNLAYGPRGSGNLIGPNATLIFEVELIKVN